MSVKARAKSMGRAVLATSIGSLLLVANPTSAHAAPTFTVNGSSVTGSLNYIYTSMTGGNSYTFNFTGSDWKTLKVKLYGAGGGHANGAAGGYVEGIVDLTQIPGKTFTIVVGGKGTEGNSSAGYNGGGSGWDWGSGVSAGGGGGATDLRLNWTTVSDYSNASRILVAGGGGGGTGNTNALGGTGGYPNGTSSNSYGGFVATGGTQSAGGAPSGSSYAASANGAFGTGGSGYGGANNGTENEWDGGGGGGYYGGAAHSYHGGGGGGSSYYNSSYVTSFLNTTGGGSAKQTNGSASIQILSQVSVTSNISLALPGNSLTAISRTGVALTATVDQPGYVVFYASGKRIPGCSRVTVVATSATCTWRPSVRNALIISATLFPSNGALASNSSISVSVGARTNTR